MPLPSRYCSTQESPCERTSSPILQTRSHEAGCASPPFARQTSPSRAPPTIAARRPLARKRARDARPQRALRRRAHRFHVTGESAAPRGRVAADFIELTEPAAAALASRVRFAATAAARAHHADQPRTATRARAVVARAPGLA